MRFELFHLYAHLRHGWCIREDTAPAIPLTRLDRIMFILCFGTKSYREMEAGNGN